MIEIQGEMHELIRDSLNKEGIKNKGRELFLRFDVRLTVPEPLVFDENTILLNPAFRFFSRTFPGKRSSRG